MKKYIGPNSKGSKAIYLTDFEANIIKTIY
jgi:hypothetical protein